MMVLKFLAAIAAGVFCLSGSALAQAAWNNLTYTAPPGWTDASKPELLAFIKKTDGRNAAVIFVHPPRVTASAASIAIQNADQVGGSGTLSPDDLREAFTTQGWRVTHGKGSNDAKGADISVVSAVISTGSAFIPIVLADFDYESANTEDKELGAFIASLSYAGAASKAPTGQGGLEGFFVSINAMPQVKALGGLSIDIGAKEMQLFKDGRMVLADPSVDAKALCRNRPTECGFYSASASQFTRLRPRTTNEENLRFLGEDERAPLKRLPNGDLDIGGEVWRKVAPRATKTLTGDFTASGSDATTGADGSTTAVYGETHYRFRSDGRVWRGGYGAFASSSGDMLPDVRVGTTMSGNSKVKTGKYTLGAYSVSIVWEDGEVTVLPFYQTGGMAVIDGDLYTPKP